MGPLISSNQERGPRLHQVRTGCGIRSGHRRPKLSGDGYDHGYVEPTIALESQRQARPGGNFRPGGGSDHLQRRTEAVELANAVDFGLVAGV
jgi:hypothetical protein